jgi:hypothetical protein
MRGLVGSLSNMRQFAGLVGVLVAAACGGNVGSDDNRGASNGGGGNQGGQGTVGGQEGMGGAASGGSPVTGGTRSTGGALPTGGAWPTGSEAATGGTKATGGVRATGGMHTDPVAPAGGRVPTGGVAATGGGWCCIDVVTGGASSPDSVPPNGGMSAAGGNSSTSTGGTVSATGGGTAVDMSSGGSGVTGGATSAGGANASGGKAATGGSTAAGGALADFCTGDAKVDFKDKTFQVVATQFEPLDTRDCCISYGMRLHTRTTIGQDLNVIVSHGGGPVAAGTYSLQSGSLSWSAWVRYESEPPSTTYHLATGQVMIEGDTPVLAPWKMGVCIQVNNAVASDLNGTMIYVPGVPMDYVGVNDRFGLWLLSDSTTTATAAAKLPLDTLTLAAQPLLSLSNLEYVEQATGFFAINSETYSADNLRQTIGTASVQGIPFVVSADGVRIYLGAVFSPVSSVAISGPMAYTDSITNDGFTIGPSRFTSASDPRFDPRIVKVLTETGRFVPAGG